MSHRCRLSPHLALLVVGCLSVACNRLKGGGSGDAAETTAPSSGAAPVQPASLPADVPFAGTYTKYAVTTFKNGRRVQSTNNSGQATIIVAQGKAIWSQSYTSGGKPVTVVQTYSYSQSDVRPVDGGFDVKLVWESMAGDATNYSPDKNLPKLSARKQAGGWQLGLTTTDNNGVTGGVEFK